MTKEECKKWLIPQQEIIDGVPQFETIPGSGFFGTDFEVHYKYSNEPRYYDLSVAEYEAGFRTEFILSTWIPEYLRKFQDRQRAKNPEIAACEAGSEGTEGGIFNGIIQGLGAAEIIGGNTVLGKLNPIRIITKNKQNADSFALIILAIFIYYSIKKYKK